MKEQPLLMVIDFGDGVVMDTASMERFAGILQDLQYGYADCQLHGLYALDAERTPVPVQYVVEGAHDFNSNDMAYPQVTVTMPDGSTLTAGYAIDGRA